MTMKPAVHISTMSGKLDGLHAISTNTTTNNFCIKMHKAKRETICSFCYSHAMLDGFRKNAKPALQRNSDLLSSRPLEAREIPFINAAYFRFQAHGELINFQHLINLYAIADANPDTTFGLWTKRKDLIKKVGYKPANVVLIYSNPKLNEIMDKPPEGFDKSFNNVSVDKDVDRQNCTGQKCKDCMACYKFDTTDTIVEMVKSYGKRKV